MSGLLSKSLAVFELQQRQAWYHKYSAFGTVLSWGLRLGITALLYAGIYHLANTPSVKGITLPIAISGMAMYALVYGGLGGREVFRTINNEYQSGVMEIWLNKPLPYIGLKVAENLGKNIPAAVGLFIAGIGLFLYSDLPQQTDHLGLRLLCGIPLLIGGAILTYIIYVLIGLSSIWIQDARALNMVHDKFVMIFGGMYVPVGFFPHWFRMVGEAIPAGGALFAGQMFYGDFLHNFPYFLGLQIFWIAVLSFALVKLNRAADKHLTVNGG